MSVEIYFIIQGLLLFSLIFTITPWFESVVSSFVPLFKKDWKYTKFIYKNLNKLEFIDNEHAILKVKGKDYIVVFLESWLYHIYEGKTREEITFKYALGGQSNKADYLTSKQKRIGKKIENYYLNRN